MACAQKRAKFGLVVVFTGGYLALAVLDRGGIGALFAEPALIAPTVVLVGCVVRHSSPALGNDGARAKGQRPVRE